MGMMELNGIILVSAIHNLFNTQPDVLIPTPYTGMTEWNFSHHLANEVSKYIFWLNCDLDVTKHYSDNRRPDIIFHKRGINELNFLVVEIKTDGSIAEDIKKIEHEWMSEPLQYRFGATLVAHSADDFEVVIFKQNNSHIFSKSKPFISVPEIFDSDRKSLFDLVDKIASIVRGEDYQKNPKKQEKVKAFMKEIDQRVYKLYGFT
jgi:hypothetical protein